MLLSMDTECVEESWLAVEDDVTHCLMFFDEGTLSARTVVTVNVNMGT